MGCDRVAAPAPVGRPDARLRARRRSAASGSGYRDSASRDRRDGEEPRGVRAGRSACDLRVLRPGSGSAPDRHNGPVGVRHAQSLLQFFGRLRWNQIRRTGLHPWRGAVGLPAREGSRRRRLRGRHLHGPVGRDGHGPHRPRSRRSAARTAGHAVRPQRRRRGRGAAFAAARRAAPPQRTHGVRQRSHDQRHDRPQRPRRGRTLRRSHGGLPQAGRLCDADP